MKIIILAIITSIANQLETFFSFLKRKANIKNIEILPGHGGVLDDWMEYYLVYL